MIQLQRYLHINSQHYLEVIQTIIENNGSARLIGGMVRDAILQKKSHDIDIATNLLPEKITEIFSQNGHQVIPTGIKFGTVTLLFKGEKFEITTLRKDLACDGRHVKVEFTNDYKLDAERRDFTINAISYCPINGIIYDYFGGLDDLANGVVKFIGNPEARIIEDHLRILRFFRFYGRFGKSLHTESYKACYEGKDYLLKISKERIKAELDLILSLDNFEAILKLLDNAQILEVIFNASSQELDLEKLDFVKKLGRNWQLPVSLELKFALLLSKIFTITSSKLLDLKFSRFSTRTVLELIGLSKVEFTDIEQFLKRLWLEQENYKQYFLALGVFQPHLADKIYTILLALSNKNRPSMPVNGNDLIELGWYGIQLKAILTSLEEQWIESNFALDRQQLLELAKQLKK